MKNALCCFLLLVLVFGACFHLPFVAFCCSSLLFVVSNTKTKTGKCLLLLVMAFCCSFWFLWMFYLSIALLVVAFCWYKKPKRVTEGKKCPNGNQASLTQINIFTGMTPKDLVKVCKVAMLKSYLFPPCLSGTLSSISL